MSKIGPDYLNSGSKRAVDIAGAIGVGCALSPAAVGALTATAVDNRPNSPFYREARIGHLGLPLTVTKFRSLPADIDINTPGYGTYDPRASKIGLLLRRFGLDEIPQLANVIGGSMSLVGVRAIAERSLNQQQMAAPALFDDWFSAAYSVAKPGLVSPSQIYKRTIRTCTAEALEQGMLMDLAYVQQASLATDVKFLGMLPLSIIMSNLRAESLPDESVSIVPTEP